MKLIKDLKITTFLFALAFSFSAFGQKTSQDEERFESYRIWAAIPVSGLIGFGLGHAIQSRYETEYGWAYTIFDSAVLASGLFFNMGDCAPGDNSCTDRRHQISNTLTGIWHVSQIAQVVDTSIWSYRYYRRTHPIISLLPTRSGLQIGAAFSF